MTEHPETYTLTRDEWMVVNRALAGASLALHWRKDGMDERIRGRRLVNAAQDILSASYERARKEVVRS